MSEVQLTMFDEVVHPLLEDIKCENCSGKNLKITTDGRVIVSHGIEYISGCYFCKVCLYGAAFEVNSIVKEA